MLIDEPKPDASRPKEVKVKIPMAQHVKLHSMKVLTGKPISDAVREALDLYFAADPLGRVHLDAADLASIEDS